MANVNVIYHHFPHYRAPVMRSLVQNGSHTYRFWGSISNLDGIIAFRGDDVVTIRPLESSIDSRSGRIYIRRYWGAVFDRSCDVLIIIGNPNIVATWFMAMAGRFAGKRVLFWAHGWRRKEHWLKAKVRNLYFGLSDRVLLYGNCAVDRAISAGFPACRLSVIYNSLDWKASRAIYEKLSDTPREVLRQQLGLPLDALVLICTARLIPSCQFELLIEAATILATTIGKVTIVLVGDGPERSRLEELSRRLNVDVRFLGQLYDEVSVAKLYLAADIMVSPGKVGLAAIHSMSYGVPVITHGNMDEQMPEVEAVEPGRTGDFFERGNAKDLALVIGKWLARKPGDPLVAAACREVVASRYNADMQVTLIERAIDVTINGFV